MKRLTLILAIVLLVFGLFSIASAAVRVKSHFRSNGSYVQSHYRSNPNHTRLDNWSTRGNYNPYTGKAGTRSYWAY